MAVGAGSIKRASKLNKEAAQTPKSVQPTKAEKVEKTETAKKATARKTPAKKTSATKKTVVEQPVEAATVQSEINKVCHLTEELPIYLL